MRRGTGVSIVFGALLSVAIAVTVLVARGDSDGSRGWAAADSAPVRRAGNASTAVTADGTVLAAWTELRRGLTAVMFSERPAGGDWSAPIAVQGPQAFAVRGPSLTADPEGNAVITFGLWARQREVLLAAFRPVGGGWEAPQALAPVTWGFYDSASAIGEGDATVTWAPSFVASGPIRGTTRPADGVWTDGTTVTPAAAGHRQMRLAVAPTGAVVMVSLTYGRSASGPAVFVRSPEGAWTRLPPAAPAGQDIDAAVAVDDSGAPVLAWTRIAAGTSALWTSRFADGRWSSARRRDRAPASNGFGTLAAASTDAGVVFAWTRWQREWRRVLVRAVTAGAPARTLDAFDVPDIRGGVATSPGPPPGRVLLGGGRTPVAMWDRLVTTDPALASEMVVSRATDGRWSTAERLPGAAVSGWPLAVGGDGGVAVAAWAEYLSPGAGGVRIRVAERTG